MKDCFAKNARNDTHGGSVLLGLLGLIALLVLMVMSLGHEMRLDLRLAQMEQERLQAKYSAWAGVWYSWALMLADGFDNTSRWYDNLNECGVRLADRSTDDVFRHIKIGPGTFDIFSDAVDDDGQVVHQHGFSDEERRININALSPLNYKVLVNLLIYLGCPDETAETVASSIVDWVDSNDEIFNPPYGAEREDYRRAGLSYQARNIYFPSLEEVLLVKGMTPDIYEKIKGYLTCFPSGGKLLVNIDTAPRPVLVAFSRSLTGGATNTSFADADSLVEKILAARRGEVEQGGATGASIDFLALPLNAAEKVLARALEKYRIKVSNVFRFTVEGKSAGAPTARIEAVVDRESGRILSWTRR